MKPKWVTIGLYPWLFYDDDDDDGGGGGGGGGDDDEIRITILAIIATVGWMPYWPLGETIIFVCHA